MPFANSTVHTAGRCSPPRATGLAADLAWERRQEQAAIAYRAGDPILPSRLWTEALGIGEKHFQRGDPRLAASLANQAVVLRWRRQDHQAQRLFKRALLVWDDSWRWICMMTPARPSLDVRQQDRDRLTVYDQSAHAHFLALAECGRAATAALARGDPWSPGAIRTWFEIKPCHISDLRRLLAAVLLIAPRPYA